MFEYLELFAVATYKSLDFLAKKQTEKDEEIAACEKYQKAMNDHGLNCRRCGGMAYPIEDTRNRYRCSCGNQFAGPWHPF